MQVGRGSLDWVTDAIEHTSCHRYYRQWHHGNKYPDGHLHLKSVSRRDMGGLTGSSLPLLLYNEYWVSWMTHQYCTIVWLAVKEVQCNRTENNLNSTKYIVIIAIARTKTNGVMATEWQKDCFVGHTFKIYPNVEKRFSSDRCQF